MFFFYSGEIQLCKVKAERYVHAEGVATESYVIFSSGTKGLKLVNEREILVHGKMYDIIKTKIANGIVTYYAISDSDEDEYTQRLNELEKNTSPEKSLPGKIIKLQLVKYFTSEKYICQSFLSLVHHSSSIKKAAGLFQYASPLRNIFSPPPNYILS